MSGRMSEETFDAIALKLQDELADIIVNGKDVNEYGLIVYKYMFISELEIPLLEDLGVEITDDSFALYIIPDDLKFEVLRALDDAFDKFELSFAPNPYNVLKLNFKLRD